jgi:hypothetical protein
MTVVESRGRSSEAERAALVSSVEELNDETSLFVDESRETADNSGPFVVVVDDFYDDPDEVRSLALGMEYRRYEPPSVEITGAPFAAANHHDLGTWSSTAVLTYHGEQVAHPFPGRRHNPPWLRRRLAAVVGETIDPGHWGLGGDGWNGAFHLIDGSWTGQGPIHHHFKPYDLEGRGWSGVVYLTGDPAPGSGTSVWRRRDTGRCVAPYGRRFGLDVSEYELAFAVENRFNRLVLFRENVLHRPDRGFGDGITSRLTQTWFFRSSPDVLEIQP